MKAANGHPAGAGTGAALHPARILIVTVADLPEGGGHTSRLKTLAGCLIRKGCRVRIWSKHVLGQFPVDMMKLRGTVEGAGYEIIAGKPTRTRGARSFFMKTRTTALLVARFFRERRSVDVLWLNELSFHDMLPLMLMARMFRMQIVQSYEDEHIAICDERPRTWKQRFFTGTDNRLADRFLVPHADAVVVISSYLREKFAACGARRIFLVPTIIDVAQWRCGPRSRSGRPRFFYSGSLQDCYALVEIIQAMGLLKSEGFDFEFHCIGDARLETPGVAEILRLVERLGLQDRVLFRDYLPIDELRQEIGRADFLLCARRDSRLSRSGQPTKLSEYLASGRPVVTSAVGDVEMYLKDGVDALIVPSTEVADMANALRTCLAGGQKMAEIGANGAAAAERHFSYEAVGRTLARLLDEIMGTARRDAAASGPAGPGPG